MVLTILRGSSPTSEELSPTGNALPGYVGVVSSVNPNPVTLTSIIDTQSFSVSYLYKCCESRCVDEFSLKGNEGGFTASCLLRVSRGCSYLSAHPEVYYPGGMDSGLPCREAEKWIQDGNLLF